jgi:hypothetical protein
VRHESTDHSFCSSVPVSHAWTALSDISLSDISAISVVALPLQSSDIANSHHYGFAEVLHDSGDNSQSQVSGNLSGLANLVQPHFAHRLGKEQTKTYDLSQDLYLHPGTEIPRSTQLKIHVYGGLDPDIYRLIEEVTTPLK